MPATAASAAAAAAVRRRRGSRREVQVLLVVALVTLVALSTFTLFSYRSSLSLLAESRRAEAARLAADVAARLAAAPTPSAADLAALAPGASGVALADSAGLARAAAGDLPSSDLLAPAGGIPLSAPAGFGPGGENQGEEASVVTGLAPVPAGGEPRFVRVDLPAAVLASQLRGLKLLSIVVLGVNGALVLLVLLSLSELLLPFERVLARARQIGDQVGGLPGGAADDDVELLLAAFDRAQAALAAPARRPEEDVEDLERTLSASLESGLLLLDREGAVLTVNPLGASLLGLPPGPPAPGATLEELLAAHPGLARLLRGAVSGGEGVQRQEHTLTAGGAHRTLGLTVHPLRRADGSPRGFLVLFADLTAARREAEASRLAESLARIGELAAGVAHELRNGLATIRGYLTLIERRPDEEAVADFLAEIGRESDHLERVLADFLAFARPGTARIEPFPLAALLGRAAADPALAGVAVAVRQPAALLSSGGSEETGEALGASSGEPDLARNPWLRGDPQLLERALRNLLRNAAFAERAAGRAGPVEVSWSVDEAGGVEVRIEDRGAGVPAELRERLFRPFATGRPGGVGLGLALAQRIVLLHGGEVLLEDRPGGGTRARVRLPADILVTEGNETPPAPALPADPPAAL